MNLAEHLSPDQLEAYLQGWVDESTSDSIEQHLAECGECEETLVALELDSDTLVQQIRDAQDQPAQPDRRENDAPDLPQDLGAYQLVRPIGQGGMGAVYLATHRQLNKSFAIKLVRAPAGSAAEGRSSGQAARFSREVRAAGGLQHSAIVTATDAGRHGDMHYLVMELIDGKDLAKIAGRRPLAIADACEIIRVVAGGIAHAHGSGVVHRDIKPSNIMLSRLGEVKILDFGLAQVSKWDGEAAELTTVGQLMGTLDYMAPEQAERPEAVDYRADLYSIGATLFRLLCGRPPLSAAPNLSPLAKLRLLANHSPPRADTLRPELPTELADLMDTLLESDPKDRPASAAHIAEALKPFCEGHDLVALARTAAVHEPELPAAASGDVSGLIASLSVAPQTQSAQQPPNRIARWLAAAALPLLLVAGVVVAVQWQKGQLIIESDAAVSVSVLKDGKTYENVQVVPGTNETKLFAGTYEITIEDASDSFSLDKETIRLQRGDVVVAKIRSRESRVAAAPAVTRSQILPTSDQVLQPGDRLRITSLVDENLEREVIVLADDTIKLRIAGVVSTARKTIVELEKILNQVYRNHYNDPGIEVFRVLPDEALGYEAPPTIALAETKPSEKATNEPLYKGKPLSQWLEQLRYERSYEGMRDALSAISLIGRVEESKPVTDALLASLPHVVGTDVSHDIEAGEKPLTKVSFQVLANLNPGQDYAMLIRDLLRDGEAVPASFIFLYAIPKNRAGDYTEVDWKPLLDWFASDVLSGPDKQNIADKVAEKYLGWINSRDPETDRFVQSIIESPNLPDSFWNEAWTTRYPTEPRILAHAIQRYETVIIDPSTSDRDFVKALLYLQSVMKHRRIVEPPFKDESRLRASLMNRLESCISDDEIHYRIVGDLPNLFRQLLQPRLSPGPSSLNKVVYYRIKFESDLSSAPSASVLFEILDVLILMREDSEETDWSLLGRLAEKTKPAVQKIGSFLEQLPNLPGPDSTIEVLWPSMAFNQFSGRARPKDFPSPRDLLDLYANLRVQILMEETSTGSR